MVNLCDFTSTCKINYQIIKYNFIHLINYSFIINDIKILVIILCQTHFVITNNEILVS